ncbi:alpha/beta-hydrolase [Choiromyces venosus 120613-1]|uniref:Alpha/beta-hydrolase n=1 Tax=Choiromyces venosus 120613-1 TaxID=1336337 RepID=A0A3N4JGW9_9PEZI|nr:alpha/beta-hydrolase [Choiromyces venosus 120613-1]
MSLLLQTKVPRWITNLQKLCLFRGDILKEPEKVKWAATKPTLKELEMNDLGRSMLEEFSTIRSRFETQESVLSVGKTKEGPKESASEDPRARQLGKTLSDEFAIIREKYRTPKNPIVLCHGLLGFDELRLVGNYLPGIHYWRGITEAFNANNIEVILTNVPASGSIEVRAKALAECIQLKAKGRGVNIIGHSMVGF